MRQLSVIPATAGGEDIQDHQRASRRLRLAGKRSRSYRSHQAGGGTAGTAKLEAAGTVRRAIFPAGAAII
jgi:hypothetical protein